jgi:CheY-like chemotaxis protein
MDWSCEELRLTASRSIITWLNFAVQRKFFGMSSVIGALWNPQRRIATLDAGPPRPPSLSHRYSGGNDNILRYRERAHEYNCGLLHHRAIFRTVNTVPPNIQLVAVVDDDESVRSAIQSALKSVGLTASSFGSAEEFLDSGVRSETACLITDLQMPGMSGLELQAKLAEDDGRIAIIFITAYGEPWMRAQAMRAGAIEFLDKPFDDNVLLETVRKALKT